MIIDFTQPSKDVYFLWGTDRTYTSGITEVYDESLQLVRTLSFNFTYWSYFSGNDIYQRIKRIILRRPNGSYSCGYGHIYLDNFQFTPITTRSPVGTLESVSLEDAATVGWSADPDNPSASNFVDCSIDGQPAGRVTANLPGAGAPYPGNHRFSFTIPTAYRDGNDHQISCTGIDITGGDPNKVLTGSPKTFNFPLGIVSTTFVPLTLGALTLNNNPGGGLRMFPERMTPTGPINNAVNVKAKIGSNVANVPVYFYAYDLDDPSAEGPPLDVDVSGRDNRATAQIGTLCAGFPPSCTFDSAAQAFRVMTNSSGEAIINFELTGAHPGDNFAVSATTDINETRNIVVNGINLRNSVTGEVLQENVKRTPMLTAWRTLHIERDSMGIIANEAGTNVRNEQVIKRRTVNVPVQNALDPGRFQNGRMIVDEGKVLNIEINVLTLFQGNTISSLNVKYNLGIAIVRPGFLYKLYDDDDFNSDNALNGFDADHGEDVEALADTYNLLQENDDTNCDDGRCNVYATAYIQPKYSWGNQFTNSDVLFAQNVNNIFSQVEEQIDRGRNLNSGENDHFWVTYVQIAYQHSVDEDCDPNVGQCTSGVTSGPLFFNVNDVANANQVPTGGQGSLAYIEAMRDGHKSTTEYRLRTVAHEIGHQFGIAGDQSEPPTNFGLMGYIGGRYFVDRHLNILRWRRRSPGA